MQWERPTQLFAHKALTSSGWKADVLITIGSSGNIEAVDADTKRPTGVSAFDLLLPGMSNLHSHAFQRGFAGLAETASGKDDHFWSWREAMYVFASRITPEQMQSMAYDLFCHLLKQGYTAVGEFHYLHHDTTGNPYSSITEMSDRVIAAAQQAGIHITHLPVMYETGGFGGIEITQRQKRFTHTLQEYLKLVEALKKTYSGREGVHIGIAPHSLRAVSGHAMQEILTAINDVPVHIHVAEQEQEVQDCIAATGKRPVEWLLQHAEVDKRWCLVHATHMTAEETHALAASGAVAGLCPTTEANLGDGVFNGVEYLRAGGAFGIGSDSHVCLSPWEELRLLEYSQRLLHKKRVLLHDDGASVGRTLFEKAAAGGAQALGIASGKIEAGMRADLVAISLHDAQFEGRKADAILDTLIFATQPHVTDVFVAGKHVVKAGNNQA